MNKRCPICSTPFPRSIGPGNPNKEFCSEDCRYKAKNATRRARRGSSYEHSISMNKNKKQSQETEKIDLSPAGWAKWILKSHDLDASQQQLVMMGLEVLTIARDPEEDFKSKMAAMGRFQAIISQLNLPKLEDAEEEEKDVPIIRVVRPSVDPRKQLRVVS